MLIGLMRHLRGYVEIEISGKFPERFINLCSRNGIALWEPLPSGNGIGAFMYVSDYKKIRPLARRSAVKTKITGKSGFPFVVRRLSGRAGIFAGAAVGVALCLFLSNFVWSVKISGAETLSEAYLTSLLNGQGVSVGAWKGDLDLDQAEREIIRACPEIRWLSLNTAGSLITAEVREAAQKPELDTSTQTCNVKAAKDGVITKVEALLGTPSVKKGSGVAAGELLISGLTETKQGDLKFVRASGYVYADVAESRSAVVSKTQNYNSLTENSASRSRLKILWFEFPCTLSFSGFEMSVGTYSSFSLCLNDVVLPVSLSTETEREIVSYTDVLTEEQALARTEADCLLYEIFERGEARLVSRNISVKENSDDYLCSCDYVFNENIAEQVDFEVSD